MRFNRTRLVSWKPHPLGGAGEEAGGPDRPGSKPVSKAAQALAGRRTKQVPVRWIRNTVTSVVRREPRVRGAETTRRDRRPATLMAHLDGRKAFAFLAATGVAYLVLAALVLVLAIDLECALLGMSLPPGAVFVNAVVAAAMAGIVAACFWPNASGIGGAVLAGLLAALTFFGPASPLMIVLLALPAGLGAGLVKASARSLRWLPTAVVAFLMVHFVLLPFTDPRNLMTVATPVRPGTYRFDGLQYLRVHELMEQGEGYYRASYRAQMERRKPTDLGLMKYLPGWRPPTVLYLWRLLPPGALWVLFLFACLAALLTGGAFVGVSHWMARRLGSSTGALRELPLPAQASGMLCCMLLQNYYAYATMRLWFPFHEFWAGLAMMAAFLAMLNHREKAAMVWSGLAVAMRELFLPYPVCFGIYAVVRRDRRAIFGWARVGLILIGLYLLHYLQVRPYLTSGNAHLGLWLQGDWWGRFQNLGRKAYFGSYFLPVAPKNFLLAVYTGLSLVPLALDRSDPAARLSGSVLVVVLSFLIAINREYWGAVFMPGVLLLAPCGVGMLFERLARAEATG